MKTIRQCEDNGEGFNKINPTRGHKSWECLIFGLDITFTKKIYGGKNENNVSLFIYGSEILSCLL